MVVRHPLASTNVVARLRWGNWDGEGVTVMNHYEAVLPASTALVSASDSRRQRKRKANGGLVNKPGRAARTDQRTVTGGAVLGHQATAGSTQRSDQLRQLVPQRRDERTDSIPFPDKKTKHTPTAARAHL
eukprot:105546-Rhodomonas_salina.1